MSTTPLILAPISTHMLVPHRLKEAFSKCWAPKGMLEMIASAFMNHFSTKNKAVENRLLAFLCLVGFFFGLPLCAQSPSASDPPVPTSPLPPPPRLYHCKSEPPMMRSEEEHGTPKIITPDGSCSISDSSDDSSDDNIRRATVIRRKTSDDDAFTQISTAESISITPLDFPRQRSLSSVAIYDQEQKNGRSKVLSQLKRPTPIVMPPK
ncbi:hypothetical protein L3Y34_012691 [Caenorhabditis briggsae]|uniref:Uncharacterized protein n=1 Tax=Caenorhabditis briggsae TaxID=6238 RepID=A0AAE8ZS22_CAEBR|nr:hypothetical protein L3Y34_012691 [Caenorhabditis briggsae]